MTHHNYFDLFLHTIFYSLLTAAAAQLQVNIFSPEFNISLGIVFLAAFAMLSEQFPLVFVSSLSGIFVVISRTFYGYMNGASFTSAIKASLPELIFYIIYGICLYIYVKKLRSSKLGVKDFLALFLCDYIANIGELTLRININPFSESSQSGILLAAFLRTTLILIFLTVFRRYHLLLIRKEHQNYYRNLTLLVSRLQEEVIWMQKNASMVESSMHASYQLYEKLRSSASSKDFAKDALGIANDIHEIKKEYFVILRGLSEVLSMDEKEAPLPITEIFSILQSPLEQFASSLHKELVYSVSGSSSTRTVQKFCLLSIFRNLFMNAVEASKEEKVLLTIHIHDEDEFTECSVTDNGPGIAPDLLPMIFDAGFSTKINYDTGEISRGLGLNIVKNIVEQQLHGSIEVHSKPGETTFLIRLPKNILEETK